MMLPATPCALLSHVPIQNPCAQQAVLCGQAEWTPTGCCWHERDQRSLHRLCTNLLRSRILAICTHSLGPTRLLSLLNTTCASNTISPQA